ncbi:hypothetical protein CSB69_0722 [Morganella morganii]|nr:hypothetical protein CSB69_0722 [Morganella morganii]
MLKKARAADSALFQTANQHLTESVFIISCPDALAASF